MLGSSPHGTLVEPLVKIWLRLSLCYIWLKVGFDAVME
jgi:hypothetical protein